MKFVTRRGALATVGVLTVSAAALALPGVRKSICGSPEEQYRRESQAKVGQVCVACDPTLTPNSVAERLAVNDITDDTELQSMISRDFIAGRFKDVDGWLLAETEILAYAASYYRLA